ncbi:MAG TPA: methylmalonyl Co-A mutase-associated GTPase MeaB [Bryobacteraceae bacterium]|nr:methylmalonyl Co-A mutase-associated GTPase MeaB [Bryobacteraceae bacterium]
MSNPQAARIRQGDTRALARLATGIENRDREALDVLRELAPFTGHARTVGITGPPGSGKSTLVDALVAAIRRHGKTVAVLAIDPSSRTTGGAILGDRIRMQQHHADPGIFIRSMATRGQAGGLARSTADLVRLMDAAGKDYVLVETVGVGQAEIEISSLAQVTVVVLVPGMGDDIQAIKAGIMEIADIFVINKFDQPGAGRVEQELRAALLLAGGPKPPVLRTVATAGTGIGELLDEIDRLLAAAVPKPAAGAQTTSAAAIDHLGIAVQSLTETVPFYEAIGLRVGLRETVPQEKVNVAMLPTSDSRIELLEPAAPDSPISNFLAKRGPGLHHLALRVPDLNAAVERLKSSGARLLNEPRAGAGGHIYVFVHPASTGGVLLELIQESA